MCGASPVLHYGVHYGRVEANLSYAIHWTVALGNTTSALHALIVRVGY